MFWDRNARDLLRTSAFRQAFIIAAIFMTVTLVALVVGRSMMEDLLRQHIREMIAKDINGQGMANRLQSANKVAGVLSHRDLYDRNDDRRSIVVDSHGTVILGEVQLYERLMRTLSECRPGQCLPATITMRDDEVHILGNRIPLADGGQYLIAYNIRPMMRRLQVVPLAAGMGMLVVMLIAVLVSFRFSLANLQRVDAISDTLERYANCQRDARVPSHREAAEFDRLGRAINRTLDRINLLVEEVKNTSGHIAHELRTPLTRLQNRLLTVAEDVPKNIRGEVLLAVEEVSRIQGLARTIMRVGEIETGRCRHHFQAVDVAALFSNLVEYYHPLAEERNCRLDVMVDAICPLIGDRDLLFQALANLMDNALKYGPEGQPIRLQGRMVDNGVDLAVVDRGVGIPSDLRAVALQRFRRLGNAHDKPGDGLGLPLVKAIAELHRGELALEDARPGLAATLRIGGAPRGAIL